MTSASVPIKLGRTHGRASHPAQLFRSRESDELVIAFSGPLGCGVETVVDAAEAVLQDSGYIVKRVKLSEHIEEELSRGRVKSVFRHDVGRAAARYNRLQDGGNALRKKFSANEILAEWAVTQIALTRTADIQDKDEVDALERHVPIKRAFLVDQLKHPAEVHLLRTVYRNLFFLVGVLSVEKRRHERLKSNGMSAEDVVQLMDRDRSEPDERGQHLDKTLELADFFLRNDRHNVDLVRGQFRRFVDLMHGMNGVSPTAEEFGMYVAYASSLASACLSRQVGAAILDDRRNVLGTGCNDVPRHGGGLYSAEAGADDARCVKQEGQRCWNDWHKMRLRDEIVSALRASEGMEESAAKKLADAVYATSRIKDLIEFSRAVHAEMEAVISVARKGVPGLVGATLYTTTFPCHSCARHIVASGVARVIYVQPYERSLALDLHGDSITLEPERAEAARGPDGRQRVEFIHFEGVAPRRYVSMLLPQGERKKDGIAVIQPLASRRKAAPEYLDSYRDFEAKVVEHWKEVSSESGPEIGA